MLSVILSEERKISLPQGMEDYFLETCAANQIKFEKNQVGDYVLLPPLKGRNIMLHSLNQTSREEDSALKRLGRLLSEQGASVLYSSPSSLRNDLMKLLEIQIVIGFAPRQSREGKAEICFFYSLKKKEESLEIIASIVRQLARDNSVLYRIANLYDYFKYLKHRKLFFTEVPTVLIQLDAQLVNEREYLEDMLVAALLEIYGKKPWLEQIQWVADLAEELNKDKMPVCYEPQAVIPLLEAWSEEISESPTEDATNDITEESAENTAETIAVTEDVNENLPGEPAEKEPSEDAKPDKAPEDKEKAKSVNTKKNTPKKKRKSMLYPPADGPVYQFSAPAGNNFVYEYPKVSPDGPCRISLTTLDVDYQKAPPKPWEYAQGKESQPDPANANQGYRPGMSAGENNALEDLKNLAEFIAKKEER